MQDVNAYPTITQLEKLDARIPPWNVAALVERQCPLCGGGGRPYFVRPDGLRVLHCDACGSWYLSPAPSEQELNEFYATYSEHHQRLPLLSDREIAADILRSGPGGHIIVQKVKSLLDLRGRRCLEVGFGRGHFLHWFRALGAVAYGVDLDADAVRAARDYLDLPNVRVGTIFDVNADETFDVILMVDFVEHPLDVMAHLEKAAMLLSDEGFLVVWTPNASAVRPGGQPVSFRVDLEHMQYFTYDSCAYVARMLGLRIVHLEGCGAPTGLEELRQWRGRRRSRVAELRYRVKSLIRSLGLLASARAIRMIIRGQTEGELRQGGYHLFCIFQRPAATTAPIAGHV
jgi:2-polyprenyl-3-methyl-5-hydroxy-6-metoxy-1,4-benzoquinol methylase